MNISPVTRSKKEAQFVYNKMSRWYDFFTAAEKPYKLAGLRMLDVQAGESVLEIGFGTGECLLALVRLVGEMGAVFGVDLSDGMAVVAQRKLRAADFLLRAHLFCGDAAHLSAQARRFDAVFISFTLELFDTPEIPVVLAEIRRVLKPGGRLVVVSMAKQTPAPVVLRWYEWAHRQFPRWVDCRPIFVRESVTQAGFWVTRSVQRMMFGLPVEIVAGRR